jgi:pimeloyl-ACP methyl ester carboxylesterase
MSTTAPHRRFRTIDGIGFRYADSGGAHERSILLTSSWPDCQWSSTRIWTALAEQARVFAVELPGFAESEGTPEVRPSSMGALLCHLIMEANLGATLIVAPDIVAVSAALCAAAQHPDRVSGLVVGAGAARFVQSTCFAGEDSDDMPTLADLLPRINAPVTIVVARRNGDVDRGGIKELADRLPRSRIAVISPCKSMWKDASVEYASVIVDSLFDTQHRYQAAGIASRMTARVRRPDAIVRHRRDERSSPVIPSAL